MGAMPCVSVVNLFTVTDLHLVQKFVKCTKMWHQLSSKFIIFFLVIFILKINYAF